MDRIHIPEKIKACIAGQDFHIDDIGQSGSTVVLLDDMVLKIEEKCDNSDRELQMMEWLQDKLPVPKIICSQCEQGTNYLLMSRLRGSMSCAPYYMEHPHEMVTALVKGLKMLWAVDIAECPCHNSLDRKLALAQYRVEHQLVDIEDCDPETYGTDGFKNPEQLLGWLLEHRPEEELVFSHGDYCLPNIFLEHGEVSGFIDLGNAGIADRWQDIALCYRSLKQNYIGVYRRQSASSIPSVSDSRLAELLFEQLGITPDWEKIKYFILLDELF